MRIIKKKKLLVMLCIGIATVLGGALIVSAGAVVEKGVNSAGLSYGSALEAETAEEEPDLIAVETKDGKMGYVYKTDLEKAEGDEISDPEEACAYMEEKYANEVRAFSEAIRRETGLKIAITPEKYEQAVSSYIKGDMAAKDVLKDLGADLSYARKGDHDQLLEEAIVAAQKANTKTIYVYDKSGETRIGKFEVD